MSHNIVIITTGNKEESNKIIYTLLKEKLIACANVIDNISSLFWWKGEIQEEKEVLILMKSKKSLFKKLSKRIIEMHTYEIPEILSIPIQDASKSYLDWVKTCLVPVK